MLKYPMPYRVEFQKNLIKETELSKNPMLYHAEFQNNVMTDDVVCQYNLKTLTATCKQD